MCALGASDPAALAATTSMSQGGATAPAAPAAPAAPSVTCSEYAARMAESLYTCVRYALIFLQTTAPEVRLCRHTRTHTHTCRDAHMYYRDISLAVCLVVASANDSYEAISVCVCVCVLYAQVSDGERGAVLGPGWPRSGDLSSLQQQCLLVLGSMGEPPARGPQDPRRIKCCRLMLKVDNTHTHTDASHHTHFIRHPCRAPCSRQSLQVS